MNDPLDTDARTLKLLVATFTSKAQEENGELIAGELDVDSSIFRVETPNVEAEKPMKLGAAPKADVININPDKMFPALERTTDKHGTGRHGAPTGLEQQARRLATGGTPPDQMGIEWGTSRPHVDENGRPLEKMKWKSVELVWPQTEEKKRELTSKSVKEIEQQVYREQRSQGASASSMFLNPELEKAGGRLRPWHETGQRP